MGFFSNMDIDRIDEQDRSYPTAEERLIWRLEDLRARLLELGGEPKNLDENLPEGWFSDEGLCMTDEDIRYTLPEHLPGIGEVQRAIGLAEAELREKYGIVPERHEGIMPKAA